ncbi:MAG: SRPBCC domain-containing protein, partial [Actinomycetota bacterium]|nr:SRPBCC domain-containing protein [Actinomycetota bacterium]
PATFEQHDFREGGEARYFMQGPEGDKAHGFWRFKVINAPAHLELEDGFADENGEPNTDMPVMSMTVTIAGEGGKTRMTTVTGFRSIEDLDRVLEMGMAEGMTEAMGQIDDLL